MLVVQDKGGWRLTNQMAVPLCTLPLESGTRRSELEWTWDLSLFDCQIEANIGMTWVIFVPSKGVIASPRSSAWMFGSHRRSQLRSKLLDSRGCSNMEYAYGLLDKGYIPDAVLRPVMRQLCRNRQADINRGESVIYDLTTYPLTPLRGAVSFYLSGLRFGEQY